ncbi:MAG: nucleoside-diphosphate kinase [Phycisphaerae bacterium]|jgi:nucleoside-diphosphate kinase
MIEKTLIIAKPDAVQRALTGEVIARFERKGLKLVAAKFIQISRETAEKHYAVHAEKPFFDAVCKYISSAPVLAMVWEGEEAIAIGRNIIGATSAVEATPGSIRGDYAYTRACNLVHGSDSPESAAYEIPLYFTEDEILAYELDSRKWMQD